MGATARIPLELISVGTRLIFASGRPVIVTNLEEVMLNKRGPLEIALYADIRHTTERDTRRIRLDASQPYFTHRDGVIWADSKGRHAERHHGNMLVSVTDEGQHPAAMRAEARRIAKRVFGPDAELLGRSQWHTIGNRAAPAGHYASAARSGYNYAVITTTKGI